MTKKLYSRDIEARMEKIQNAIYDLDQELAKQGSEATLCFVARKYSVSKEVDGTYGANVTVWLGNGVK